MTQQEKLPYSDCPSSDYQINKTKTELKRIKRDCLNRLKEQYKHLRKYKANETTSDNYWKQKDYYDAMRLFCLDTQLISFNDIELLEFEINTEIEKSIQNSF